MSAKQQKISETEQVINAGKQTRFWDLITAHMRERIEILTEHILEDEDMEENERKKLKNKLAVYRYLLKLPDIIIAQEQGSMSRDFPEIYEGDKDYFGQDHD